MVAQPQNQPPAGRPPYHGPTFSHSHPALGNLIGRSMMPTQFNGASTVQFRSIPYATIPRRFAPSLLLTEIPQTFDGRPAREFTVYGAACPQAVTIEAQQKAVGGSLEGDMGLVYDEFTCLTLSISAPQEQLEDLGRRVNLLPVLVYVHGGAAQEGIGHVDGLHDNAPLASFAQTLGMPVIAVNIGYRLNWFSGLVCEDLISEYQSDPSTSPFGPFNLGLQDQRNAFTWIHKYISGFGGDPENITAFGESAGSIMLTYHICGSEDALFKRAALQSGLAIGNSTLAENEFQYQRLLEHFDIRADTPSERLAQLRKVPYQSLANYAGTFLRFYLGDVPSAPSSLFTRGIVTTTTQMRLLPTCSWLSDIILGDDFWEGSVVLRLLHVTSPTTFIPALQSLLSPSVANNLLAAYNIETHEPIDPNRFWYSLSLFIGDLIFSQPCHEMSQALASHGGRKVYRYTCCLSNPFPGSDISFATGHHFVDILFVFLTLLDRYPRHRNRWLERQARETARRWIAFANGQPPWEEYSSEGEQALIAVCDDLRGWDVRTLEQDARVSKDDPWGERRYGAWEKIRTILESLRGQDDTPQTWDQKAGQLRTAIVGLALGLGPEILQQTS